jgi:opacity protein-like surface antigen
MGGPHHSLHATGSAWVGLELEGHDINFGRPSDLSTMRQDTFGGGPIYTWRHYRTFHPYAKYMIGMGSIDFPPLPNSPPTYTHDTRTVYAPGGGLEYRAFRNLWVRGDYDYQYWPKIFGLHTLTPNGCTFGVAYDFRGRGRK